MNHVLSLVRDSRKSSDSESVLRSARMLSELLSLHEETVAQLLLKRISAVDAVEFLTVMIEQHESAAQRLRLQLAGEPEAKAESRAHPPRTHAAG